MKLKNKKTGEIGFLIVGRDSDHYIVANDERITCGKYNSLAELNEEWEDCEEPEGWWFIDSGYEAYATNSSLRNLDADREIGNYFTSKEEAEKAVEKLKAWKRLKDVGITFKNWTINQTGTIDCFATWGDNIPPSRKNPTLLDDLDLLFGGEE